MLRKGWHGIQAIRAHLRLPAAAKAEQRRDIRVGLGPDPGPEQAIALGLRWLTEAQDCSGSQDGGVARHFSLVSGWANSYPETTGYIVPTLLEEAVESGNADLHRRAVRMLHWLVSIQFPEGGIRGGVIGESPVVPVTFNTGQVLLGFAAGVRHAGEEFRLPMRAAANWLVTTQDPDGCWRRHPTPFAAPGEKAYETHVAWGLLEAARHEPGAEYASAAFRNLEWALTLQRPNGWFERNCLGKPSAPLTHTIGYVLRGLIEGWRYDPRQPLLDSAVRCASGALSALADDGRLPGRLSSTWEPAASWVCLTGSAQLAHCWLLLYQITGEARFLLAGRATNGFVRRTLRTVGSEAIVGGVKGSFPAGGEYGRFEYLNWACKFMIDANRLELRVGA